MLLAWRGDGSTFKKCLKTILVQALCVKWNRRNCSEAVDSSANTSSQVAVTEALSALALFQTVDHVSLYVLYYLIQFYFLAYTLLLTYKHHLHQKKKKNSDTYPSSYISYLTGV